MLKAIRKSLPMLLKIPPDRHQKTSRCCCKKVVMYFFIPYHRVGETPLWSDFWYTIVQNAPGNDLLENKVLLIINLL